MSTVKNPRQKKKLSLKRDHRSTDHENAKAHRRKIARGKQLSHMDERRTVAQVLHQLKGHVEEDDASNVELEAKVAIAASHNHAFRKAPDVPLEQALAEKKSKKPSPKKAQSRLSGR
jgi:hypothetical protein